MIRIWRLAMMLIGVLLGAPAAAACLSPTADQTIAVPGRPFAAEPSADNCRLFVSLMPGQGQSGGSVAVLANRGGTFGLARTYTLAHGSGGGLALSHDGALLAVAAGDTVVLLDVGKLMSADEDPLVATLPQGAREAIYTAFSRDDATLFVSEERNASIAVIDVARFRAQGEQVAVGRIRVGQAPVGLALSADGKTLFSTNQSAGAGSECKPEQANGRPHAQGALLAIDVVRAVADPAHAVVGAIRAGCNPVRVAASSDGRTLWVSARGDGTVIGFDPAMAASGRGQSVVVAVGPSPVGLAIRPDGAQLWVANSDRFSTASGSLALVTPASPAGARLATTLKVGAFPRDLRFLPDGRTLVVALFGAQAVLLHPTGGSP